MRDYPLRCVPTHRPRHEDPRPGALPARSGSVAGVGAKLDRFLERGPVLDLAREVERVVFVISALARGYADATRGSRTWERGP